MPRPKPVTPPVPPKVQFADVYFAARTNTVYPTAIMTWANSSDGNAKMLSDVSAMGESGTLQQYPGLLQIVVDEVNKP